MMVWVSVAIGGAIGSLLRYFLVRFNTSFTIPYGTLIANLVGTFLLGYLYFHFVNSPLSKELKEGLTHGLLGALTTFSTIQVQLFQFLENQEYSLFTLYLFLNIFVGLCCVFAAKWVFDLTL